MNELGPQLRLEIDRTVRRFDGGRTLVGGSPLRVLRLSRAGVRQLGRWASGEVVTVDGPARRLAQRLLDAGVAHPRWSAGPYGVDDVTAVVPVRDDADGLRDTVRAVSGVAAVVVVDDGSQDAGAVRAAAGDSVVVRREHSGGPAVAREAGREHVATPLVAFVDADCRPEGEWWQRILPHFADPAVVAVAPRVRSPHGPTVLERYEAVHSPLDLGDRPAQVLPGAVVSYVPTACLVARSDVASFDPALRFGEDVDLVWRTVADGGVVRYDPSAVAWHRPRRTWRAWLLQRFGYGSSAAPLAVRHGAAVTPLRISRWSAAAWVALALRRPFLGLAIVAVATTRFPRRLEGVGVPRGEAVRLALTGHLRAGRWLATAARRVWWPPLALLALVWPRARPGILAAAVVPTVLDWPRRGRTLDPVRYVALRLADDLAYGAGVWTGAARERSLDALRPELVEWPGAGVP